jgi:predicted TIM-barrel fold metal-dependent hydrolase
VSEHIHERALAPLAAELDRLLPDCPIIDAHTHLGLDEDGRSLTPQELLAALDEVDAQARAVVFPLHDPDRHPAYRLPNDRVLAWAREAQGRLIPFCRLDPAEDPVGEARRAFAAGARGIKLHPRAQDFAFDHAAAESIFSVARDAGVPILIHAGRGMGRMDALADMALRFPEVPLILAHAGIADQGMFATRLAEHPAVVYDTSTFSAVDVIELFARVPAERIVFASDIPYGRPRTGLYLVARVAAYAGLDEATMALVLGGTIEALVEGRAPAAPAPPRVPEVRPVNGRLARVIAYLSSAMGAALGGGPPFDLSRALQGISLARAVCRDPSPGGAGEALARIDALLEAALELVVGGGGDVIPFAGLIGAASVIAATEPVTAAVGADG